MPQPSNPFDLLADLLKVVADPKESLKRLNEHTGVLQQNAKAASEAAAHHEEASNKLDEAFATEQRAKALVEKAADKERDVERRDRAVTERERAVTEKERDLEDRYSKHRKHVGIELDDLLKREADLTARETKLAPALKKYEADRKLLDEKIEEARRFLK